MGCGNAFWQVNVDIATDTGSEDTFLGIGLETGTVDNNVLGDIGCIKLSRGKRDDTTMIRGCLNSAL